MQTSNGLDGRIIHIVEMLTDEFQGACSYYETLYIVDRMDRMNTIHVCVLQF